MSSDRHLPPGLAPGVKVDAGIIAGGSGTRMGGADKGLLECQGEVFVARIAQRLRPFCDRLIINCNRNSDRYARWADQLVGDGTLERDGPLAGLKVLLETSRADYLLVCPCDTPRIPADYGRRMLQTLAQHPDQLVAVKAGARIHPLHLLLPTHLHTDIAAFLAVGERRMMGWLARQPVVYCDFSAQPEDFANVNSPEELRQLVLPHER